MFVKHSRNKFRVFVNFILFKCLLGLALQLLLYQYTRALRNIFKYSLKPSDELQKPDTTLLIIIFIIQKGRKNLSLIMEKLHFQQNLGSVQGTQEIQVLENTTQKQFIDIIFVVIFFNYFFFISMFLLFYISYYLNY